MTNLHDILQTHVSNGSVPGAVGLVARGDINLSDNPALQTGWG